MDLPFLKNDITKILRPKNRSFILDTFNALNAQATRFGYKKGRAK